MNGRLTADATSLERSQLLAAILDSPFMDTPQRIETLYLATLYAQADRQGNGAGDEVHRRRPEAR